ncbi:hypothetical protein R6Q59_018902 [Mikania micrantha]|uniref:Receptor-like serine/threonine-protein kinase n=1 Tax=Mikania micrantha TaxID=192012 RepID=A0A5N6LZI9_9ASTR|nr:hypothetical protein E3N88_34802 [Mikania micrantha]
MKERREIYTTLIFRIVVVCYVSITYTFAADIVSANQAVRYNETIVSHQETFELGFFSPGKSMNLYVGIWYKKVPNRTVIWVANRNTPLTDTNCELTLTFQGVLVIRNTTAGKVVWSSSNLTSAPVKNPIGQLLDTGNFIIYEEGVNINQESLIWQSFDYVQHTLYPGVKLGWDLGTGNEKHLTSWKSEDDPAIGEYTCSIDIRGYPQIMIKKGLEIISRGGPWNGLRYTGSPNMAPNWFYNFTFVLNQREIYYEYNLINTLVYTRLVLQPTGRIERFFWTGSKQEWNLYFSPQTDLCDQYAVCGPFGSCNIGKSPVCECLKGFEPTSPDQWRDADWSQGCRHTTPLDCNPAEGFHKYLNLKLPDTRESWYDQTMSLTECEKMCKTNCSCTAYTHSNISEPASGCLLWFGNLTDLRTFTEHGDTLYIRLSASELDSIENSRKSRAARRVRVIVLIAFVVLIIIVLLCIYRFYSKRQRNQETPIKESGYDPEIRSDDEDLELPVFGMSTILKATNNFSVNAKLGEGGFGPVYKGALEDGQEIAVKRLAKTSTQGLREFKNEVISISKLQHRNLVKLLGCCIEGAEKMLIYEYMPNKGLDSFIFDKTRSKLLDWSARYRIINGIARGLLYLHQDSRLRFIHRDLKVSNILLDMDMNPKISDFGMARPFTGNQIEANTNTNRVVGTYGYMAPEYAGDGIFSTKSDVYSFGVLVLETVCGEKNRRFVHKEHCNNLIGHAWVLHNEGKSLQLVAKCLGESINVSQVQRSIHVSLLCVQRHPDDRPTMTSVILMLGSEGPLPSPKEPGFYVGKTKQNATQSSSSRGTSSNNELSISMLDGR